MALKLRLKEARKMKGQSLRKAAEELGLSHQDLHRMEHGLSTKIELGSENIIKIAKHYGVTVDYLMPKKEEPIVLKDIHWNFNSKNY